MERQSEDSYSQLELTWNWCIVVVVAVVVGSNMKLNGTA